MAQKDVGNKVPIYKLKTTKEVMNYYDEWGENDKYNKDMLDWNYTGPKETVETFIKHEANTDGLIFTPANTGVASKKTGVNAPNYKVTWEESFKWKPPEFNTIDFLLSTIVENFVSGYLLTNSMKL